MTCICCSKRQEQRKYGTPYCIIGIVKLQYGNLLRTIEKAQQISLNIGTNGAGTCICCSKRQEQRKYGTPYCIIGIVKLQYGNLLRTIEKAQQISLNIGTNGAGILSFMFGIAFQYIERKSVTVRCQKVPEMFKLLGK